MVFESAAIDVVAVVDGEFASTLGDSKSGRPDMLKQVQPQVRGSDFSLDNTRQKMDVPLIRCERDVPLNCRQERIGLLGAKADRLNDKSFD